MQGSFLHWPNANAECYEDRPRMIGSHNKDGSASRCPKSTKIYCCGQMPGQGFPQTLRSMQNSEGFDPQRCAMIFGRNSWKVIRRHAASNICHYAKTSEGKLHAAHTRMQSYLRRPRKVVYWPGVDKYLTTFILKCEICNTFQSNQVPQPLNPHGISSQPQQTIATEIFTVNDEGFLCTMDCYSTNCNH